MTLPFPTIAGSRESFGQDVTTLATHPRMSLAARKVAESFVAQFEHHPILSLVIGDRARLLMAWIALYFDASHDPADPLSGLTVNRFKTACDETGLCSRGRASAMLGIMRFAGLLEAAQDVRKGYPLRLEPTEDLRAAHRLRVRSTLTAIAEVLPEGRLGVAGLGNPAFEKAFIRTACEEFLLRQRPASFAPAMQIFFDNKAGLPVLMALITSVPGGELPDLVTPMLMPVPRLSASFSLSRTEIRQVLDNAVREGLLTPALGGDAGYCFTPQLRHAFLTFLAAFFVIAATAVRDAAAAARLQTVAADA